MDLGSEDWNELIMQKWEICVSFEDNPSSPGPFQSLQAHLVLNKVANVWVLPLL